MFLSLKLLQTTHEKW